MHSLYCENCEQSKKVFKLKFLFVKKKVKCLFISFIIQDLNDAKLRLEEFQSIAKKIVQTDLLYSKYADKERECAALETNLKNKQQYFHFYQTFAKVNYFFNELNF